MTTTINQKLLADVLNADRVRAAAQEVPAWIYREVPPAAPQTTQEERVIEQAAAEVRAAYVTAVAENKVRLTGEAFHEACGDTYTAIAELAGCVADDRELSVVKAILNRANLLSVNLMPTPLRAQVELQIAVVTYARKFCRTFMKQEALAF